MIVHTEKNTCPTYLYIPRSSQMFWDNCPLKWLVETKRHWHAVCGWWEGVCEVVEAAAQVRGGVIIVCVLPSSWVLSYVDV